MANVAQEAIETNDQVNDVLNKLTMEYGTQQERDENVHKASNIVGWKKLDRNEYDKLMDQKKNVVLFTCSNLCVEFFSSLSHWSFSLFF